MPRTVADLTAEVLHDEFSSSKYSALVLTWLNEAAQKVSRAIRLPSSDQTTTITTVAGTQNYALASTIERVYSVRLGDRYLPEIEIDDAVVSASSGSPAHFAIWGSEIYFWPTPSAAETVTVRFRGDLAAMTDTGSMNLPDDFADLLVNYARAKAFAAEDDWEGHNFYRGLFEAELPRARAALQARTANRVHQVEGMMQERWVPRFQKP